jgi:hypothetical protein
MNDGIDIDAVHRNAKRRGRPGRPVSEMVAEKASRPGGISRSDLLGYFHGDRREEASLALEALAGSGEICRATRPAAGGRGMPAVRFFGTAAEGAEWIAEGDGRKRVVKKPQQLSKPLAPLQEQTAGKAWRNLQQRLEPGPTVVPDHVKRTVCPSPQFDARFQIDPRQRVVGGFASMGPGRYLDSGAS